MIPMLTMFPRIGSVLLLAGALAASCGGRETRPSESPPAIASLAFRAEPSNSSAIFALTPVVQVAVLDASGNTIASSNASVSVELGANPSGAALLGTARIAAASGIASFPGLRITEPGTGYTLVARAEGSSASATSAPFDVNSPRIAVDQQQPITDSTTSIFIGGTSEQKLAQVITAGVMGWLGELKLPVGCSTGNLVVELQGVTNDKPNGTILTSETIAAADIPEPVGSVRDIVLSSPILVTPGEKVAFVLRSTGNCGMVPGPPGNPYPGGDGYYDARPNAPGVWVALGSAADLSFATWVVR